MDKRRRVFSSAVKALRYDIELPGIVAGPKPPYTPSYTRTYSKSGHLHNASRLAWAGPHPLCALPAAPNLDSTTTASLLFTVDCGAGGPRCSEYGVSSWRRSRRWV